VIVVDDAKRVIEVVVEDMQLSLAIGKKGQNVRLAAKLTGWTIDIKNEEEKRREVEAQFEGFGMPEEAATLTLPGFNNDQIEKLSDAGLDTADRLLAIEPAKLAEIVGIDLEATEQLQAAVREQVEAAERAAAEEAEASAEGKGDDAETPPEDGDAATEAQPPESETKASAEPKTPD